MEEMRVGLEHLEKLHANRNIDFREFADAMGGAFPLIAAELRSLRKLRDESALVAAAHDRQVIAAELRELRAENATLKALLDSGLGAMDAKGEP